MVTRNAVGLFQSRNDHRFYFLAEWFTRNKFCYYFITGTLVHFSEVLTGLSVSNKNELSSKLWNKYLWAQMYFLCAHLLSFSSETIWIFFQLIFINCTAENLFFPLLFKNQRTNFISDLILLELGINSKLCIVLINLIACKMAK